MSDEIKEYCSLTLYLSVAGTVLVVLAANSPDWLATEETKLVTFFIVSSPLAIAACYWVLRTALSIGQQISRRQEVRAQQWRLERPERERVVAQQRSRLLAARVEVSRQREVRLAIQEAERFYRRYAVALVRLCPQSLFIARLRAEITAEMTGPEAWAAARQLIASLQPSIVDFELRKQEAKRQRYARLTKRRRLEREISQHRQRIQQLSNSHLVEAGLENEAMSLETQIRELNAELEMLQESFDLHEFQESH